MKKILSIILAVTLVAGSLCFHASATNGLKQNPITVEPDFGEAFFDRDYAEIGKPIKLCVESNTGIICKWYIDNVLVSAGKDSYTPLSCDSEAMLTVEAFDPSGTLVARKSIFISELPVVYIETENREKIKSKEIELNAAIKIRGNAEYTDTSQLYDGTAKIKGRGNTTWNDDKKPYKLKLDSKTDLFGMGKSKHWVLLANAYDHASARNLVSNMLANDFGMNAMSSTPVEVVLNGQIMGSYDLCEHVRIDSGRVDITDWDSIAEKAAKAIYNANKTLLTEDDKDELIDKMTEDLSWTTSDTVEYNSQSFKVSDYYSCPDITGGYLFGIDAEVNDLSFKTPNGQNIVVDKPEGLSADMKTYLSDYCNAFDRALFSEDFCTEYNGKRMRYTDFIDVESFVKGVLVNEIMQNKDFGFKSTNFSKDVDGKIVYGPVWDFDLSAGDIGASLYYNSIKCVEWKWLDRLFSDPYFLSEFRRTYWEYRYTAIEDMIKDGGNIDTTLKKVRAAAQNDEKYWSYDNDFNYEADMFKDWMTRRIEWLDEQLSSFEKLSSYLFALPYGIHFDNTIQFFDGDDSLFLGTDIALSKVDIYADGVFSQTVYGPDILFEAKMPDAKTITGIGYDEQGKIIASGYWLKQKPSVSELRIDKLPDKLIYNPGEEINTDGLKLTAVYADGITAQVTPDAVYGIEKKFIGLRETCLGRIPADKNQNIALRFYYDGHYVDCDVTVNGLENYQYVQSLIEKIPSKDFSESFYKEVFEAKIAYDSLSETAKKNVENADRLASAMAYIDSLCAGATYKVLTVYVNDIYLAAGLRNRMVVILKGNPYYIKSVFDEGGSSSYMTDSKYFVSKVSVGDYTIWTLNISPKSGTFSGVNYPVFSDPYKFTFDKNTYRSKNINSISYNKSVFEGETVNLSLDKKSDITDIRLIEDGQIVKAFDIDGKCSITYNEPGVHKLTVEYKDGTDYIKYDDIEICVRSKDFSILGDVNSDGKINSADALIALQHTVGRTTLEDKQFELANVSGDKVINSLDALKILQFATGSIKSF